MANALGGGPAGHPNRRAFRPRLPDPPPGWSGIAPKLAQGQVRVLATEDLWSQC